MRTEATLTLPWPPTVNTYYRAVGGKVLISQAGRAYREAVGWEAVKQGLPTVRGRLAVEVDAHPPDRRVRDLDNLLKGLLDALRHAHVIDDDGHIDDLRVVRRAAHVGGKVVVRIKRVAEEVQEDA